MKNHLGGLLQHSDQPPTQYWSIPVQFLAGYQHTIHDVNIMYKNKWCVVVNTCKEFDTLPVSQGDVLVRGPSRPVRGGTPDGPGGTLFY